MQQDADIITADFLYMFRALCAHHQEYICYILQKYLYRWLPCQYFILLMMDALRSKHIEKVCSNKICILLHHVGVLFNPI